MVEHRYYPRLPTALKVGVRKDNNLLGYYETENISREGIGLWLQRPKMIKRSDVVGLEFNLNGDKLLQKGLVVYVAPDKIGVMFTEIPNCWYLNLLDLLSLSNGKSSSSMPNHCHCETQNQTNASTAYMNIDGMESASSTQTKKIVFNHDLYLSPKGLMVRTGERFDISSMPLIKKIIEAVVEKSPTLIVIDMTKTRNLFDSGIALLMLLVEKTGEFSERIYIVNGDPIITDKLNDSPIGCQVNIL